MSTQDDRAEFCIAIARVVEAESWGTATHRRSGRNPKWPFVAIIRVDPREAYGQQTETVRGYAFATAAEADAMAQEVIDGRKASFRRQLERPNMRALREHYGLPRDPPPAREPRHAGLEH